MHSPRYHLVITVPLADRHDRCNTRGNWLGTRTGAGGTAFFGRNSWLRGQLNLLEHYTVVWSSNNGVGTMVSMVDIVRILWGSSVSPISFQ